MAAGFLKGIRWLVLCAALAFPATAAGAIPFASHTVEVASSRQGCVVYITRTGDRYHVDDCRYLKRSRIPVEKREAIKNGYTPCKVCGGSNC